jgi:hypothetical protein
MPRSVDDDGGIGGEPGLGARGGAAVDAGADGGDGDGDAAEAVATWRGFIVGMLGNLGPLPVDRIHNTLRQFAAWGPFPYTKEVHELRALLAALHAQGVVRAREDNLYELPA